MMKDWIRSWALYTPHRPALKDHSSGRSWTYAELNRDVDRIARLFDRDMGLLPGQRVAVLAGNIADYPLIFFAVRRLGLILVPLNFRLTLPELSVLLKDAEPSLLICEPAYEDLARELVALHSIPALSALEDLQKTLSASENDLTVSASEDAPAASDHPSAPSDPDIDENDPVMILYTSGTTGIPKGAMITEKMLFYNSINTELRLDINSFDHTLGFAPFFHTGGWNVLFTPFMHHGASVTLLDKFDPDTVLRLIEEEKVTLLFGVPTMLQMMADSPEFDKRDLSSLRYAVVGGAPMPIPLIRIWHQRGVWIRQGYGLTEVGPNCFSLHQDDAERKKGSIGFPNFYIDARIVAEDGRICGPGEVGELQLKSPVVTPGYWRRPKETALAVQDGWFHTGDMVQRDSEGFYYVVDRKKNMYISGGENVYPAEIEAVIDSLSAVLESAVVPIPDSRWGESGKAYIVKRSLDLDEETVLAHCRSRLAKYKIPREIEFIEALPRNDAGKIDRKSLTQRGEIR